LSTFTTPSDGRNPASTTIDQTAQSNAQEFPAMRILDGQTGAPDGRRCAARSDWEP